MAVTLTLDSWEDVVDLIDALHAARAQVGPSRAARYLVLADVLGDAVDSLPDPSRFRELVAAHVVKQPRRKARTPRIPHTDDGRLRVGTYRVTEPA